MKRLIPLSAVAMVKMAVAGCEEKKATAVVEQGDTVAVGVPDTAVYGVVGKGTSMHVLELQKEDGKTATFAISQDSLSDVQGGLFAGDKVTLTTRRGSDNMDEVVKLVNLTTLLGKWTSLDRNFEIQEGGTVLSTMKAESRPYTQWSMANGDLILNADTFSVLLLAPDSMYLENDNGIFVYKRQK